MALVSLRTNGIKRKSVRGVMELKILFEKLIQKSTLLCRNKSCSYCKEGCCVPEDVKEGHFTVIAAADNDGEGPKRFVVPLSFLNNTAFLRLLEKAAEEYGFDQAGAITIPCRPSELELLLKQQCYSQTAG
ncbi:hypothetical protein RIF29_31826 [Crotalaria pallida]|uniref:Uncharacterized protein n=1 Tax=Crotalaria pallida TaxID=3830 RepID=A0AAN9HVG8_CROPI